MLRVTVFIDAQNFYRGARRAFFDDAHGPSVEGQFNPMALGELLAQRDAGRELTAVRLYTGRPDAYLQPVAHRASVRQSAAWESAGSSVVHRPLRYPVGWPNAGGRRPEEKGIDVALAVDLTRMAQEGLYDTAILCTVDSDLAPAIEDVLNRTGRSVEVAAWRSKGHRHRLSLDGRNLWCHWLQRSDYDLVRDDTDYTRQT
ncbi:MAG: NYN domain-containing protein [Dehalococcoidia bacterium]